ncbi:MAG: serine hydrolase domain-containing protein [Bacilli bacterium]
MIKGLNALLQEAIDNGVFPGVNYCLIADQVYLGSLGKRSLFPQEEPNNLETLYDLASVSKVVSTTTCIMLLMEKGKLRLYDQIAKYLPQFRHQDIVIWDLLTHTSGLQSDIPRASKLVSKEEALEKIFACDPIYPKNSKIVYSDIGFILLGMVVEAIAQMPLNEFARINLFEPLGMMHTGYNPIDINLCAPTELRQDDIYQGYVRGHVHDEKAYILGGVAGHAGVFSTVSDLSHFMQMILDDGKYFGKQILSKPTVDLLFRKQVEVATGISLDTDARGLGWIVRGSFCSAGDFVSPNTILHTGFTGTNLFIDRTNRIAFCMLSNRVHPTRDNVKIIPFRAKIGNYVLSHFQGGSKSGN